MKNLLVVICAVFAIINLNPLAVSAKGTETPKLKKSTECPVGPGRMACIDSLVNNESQDVAIRHLERQVRSLRRVRSELNKAKAEVESATKRISALEEARKALPPDLVGKSKVEKMITDAQTSGRKEIDKAIELLQSAISEKIAALEARVTKLESRMTGAEGRLDDVETTLANRVFSVDIGLAGIASNGVSGGGLEAALLIPLGMNGNSFLRGAGWIGGAPNGIGWGASIGIGWWMSQHWALGFAALYAADEGNLTGMQNMSAGVGPNLRFEQSWFQASVTPFVGVAGQKPDQFIFGGGATMSLGCTF